MRALAFRRAERQDTERIAEIIHGEPTEEAIGLSGGLDKARSVGTAIVRMAGSPQGWPHTVLAELDGEPVGILQAGDGLNDFKVTSRIVLRLLLPALRVYGPLGLLNVVPRLRARGRLDIHPPAGAFHIREIHVDPRYRNRGIGGAILHYAEEDARRSGYRLMSLTTNTANPARRLYERHGFRVVETRTDREYARYTGISGRLLMIKELE